jgi:hypothetical protein
LSAPSIGKIFAALLEQTKLMMDEGVDPEINPVVMEGIFALPPDERPAKFAYELALQNLPAGPPGGAIHDLQTGHPGRVRCGHCFGERNTFCRGGYR